MLFISNSATMRVSSFLCCFYIICSLHLNTSVDHFHHYPQKQHDSRHKMLVPKPVVANLNLKQHRIHTSHPMFKQNPRIIGGHPAAIGQFPYQVSVRCNHLNICGGFLYNDKTVVTAAHCCVDFRYCRDVEFQMGSLMVNDTKHGQMRKYKSHIIHPDNRFSTADICLVFMDEPFIIDGKTVGVIPLGKKNSCNVGDMCVVAGFGIDEIHERPQRILNYLEMPILAKENCPHSDAVDETHICAGYDNLGKRAYMGDSGSALACKGLTCGIVSFGIISYGQTFFTNVPFYADWIHKNAKY